MDRTLEQLYIALGFHDVVAGKELKN